jgi:hypothetical protein
MPLRLGAALNQIDSHAGLIFKISIFLKLKQDTLRVPDSAKDKSK